MSDAMRRCPACKQPLSDSFQTKCPTCGHELTSAESGQSVKEFFQKLDEVTQREYEADKQREGQVKKKQKQPKAVVLCEVIAVVSIILIILYATGINRVLRILPMVFLGGSSATETYDPEEMPEITIVNNTGYEIQHIYISPSTNDQWGYNWLSSNQVLGNDQYVTFPLPPLGDHRRYDIQLRDGDGDTYTRQNINVSQTRRIVFTFQNID